MKPFKVATTALCSENKPTISVLRPIVHHFINNLVSATPPNDDNIEDEVLPHEFNARAFKEASIKSLKTRFDMDLRIETNDTPLPSQVASFLDPRVKNLSTEGDKNYIVEFVKKTLRRNVILQENITVPQPAPTALDYLFGEATVSQNWESQFLRYQAEPQIGK